MNKMRTKNAEVSSINGHPACLNLGVQSSPSPSGLSPAIYVRAEAPH